jgi:hypothetical protein
MITQCEEEYIHASFFLKKKEEIKMTGELLGGECNFCQFSVPVLQIMNYILQNVHNVSILHYCTFQCSVLKNIDINHQATSHDEIRHLQDLRFSWW